MLALYSKTQKIYYHTKVKKKIVSAQYFFKGTHFFYSYRKEEIKVINLIEGGALRKERLLSNQK